MRLLKVCFLLLALLILPPQTSEAAPPVCDAEVAFDFCNCVMYPFGEPVDALVAPLFRCFTDTQLVQLVPMGPKYPRGLIPYITYKGLTETNLVSLFNNIVTSMLSIAVALWGFKMYTGTLENLKTETLYMVMKVAGIYYFFSLAPSIYLSMLDIIQEMTDILVLSLQGLRGSIDANGAFWNNCAQATPGSGIRTGAPPVNTIQMWEMWDCMFDNLIGFGTVSKIAAFAGIVGFAGLLAHTLAPGILVMFIVSYLITTLFLLATRFLFTYVISVLALSFMFIVGYMFTPLIMFKSTYHYFHKWLNFCIAFTLTPIVMVGFMCFGATLLDVALFTGSKSVYESLKAGYKNKVYKGVDGLGNPLPHPLEELLPDSKKRTDYKVVASIDHANNAGKGCTGIAMSQGILPNMRNNFKVTGDKSLLNQKATVANIGMEYMALNLTKCIPKPPAATIDLANPYPPGCTMPYDEAGFPIPVPPGLADEYNGPAPGGTIDSWKYVVGITKSTAFAALLVYILNALFKQIPSLVNGLVSQGVESGVVNMKKVPGLSDLNKIAGDGVKQILGQNGKIKEMVDSLNKSVLANRNLGGK